MLELTAALFVSAIAVTFVTDAASDTVKLVRASRRRSKIQVADPELTSH